MTMIAQECLRFLRLASKARIHCPDQFSCIYGSIEIGLSLVDKFPTPTWGSTFGIEPAEFAAELEEWT